jgi:hypothetical protein
VNFEIIVFNGSYIVRVPSLSYSMEHSHSLEGSQSLHLFKKFPAFLRNPKFLYSTYKCPPPVPIVSKLYPLYTTPCFSPNSIIILSSHLRLCLISGLFPTGSFTNYLCTPLSYRRSTTLPNHLIILYFITRTILGKEYSSFSSSVCNFLHSAITSTI